MTFFMINKNYMLAGFDEGFRGAGRVDIFSLSNSNGTWRLLGNIANVAHQNEFDNLGRSVSLSDDGKSVAFGVFEDHSVQIHNISNDDNGWSQVGSDIKSDQNETADSASNTYTSLSGDGLVGAIGLLFEEEDDRGHVHVYEYSGATREWVQRGLDIDGLEAGDNLGFSTWLNRDGTILAAGAFQKIREKTHAGYACVYQWDNSKWNTLGSCVQGETIGEHFGVSVSMSGDASILAVGGDLTGHVRVFKWNETSKTWNKTGSDIDGEKNGDLSGFASVISYDGSIVAVGSPKGGEHESGHVRLFKFDANTKLWEKLGQTLAGKNNGDRFGISLSLANNGSMVGTRVAIGSDGDYVRVYELQENL